MRSLFGNIIEIKIPNQTISSNIVIGENNLSTETPINYSVFSFSSSTIRSIGSFLEKNSTAFANHNYQKPDIG